MGIGQNIRPGVVVMAFGFLGVILSFVEQYLVENGYLLDQYMQDTITLPDLQIVTVIAALLLGAVVAAWTA